MGVPRDPKITKEATLSSFLHTQDSANCMLRHGSIRGQRLRRCALTPVATASGMSIAVLMIAVAYAANRASMPIAHPLFWIGEALLYAIPAAAMLLPRVVSRLQAQTIALFLPLTSYVIEQSYGPGQLLFLDEFEHVRTAQGILSTHHLFHPNIALSVSPQYPGLEIVTTALVTITHLPLTVAAVVVVGVLHCLFGLGLYLFIWELTGRHRWAAVATLVYATEPHFQFFDSYFIYQVMALPFLASCLLATVKLLRSRGVRSQLIWGTVAVLGATVTVISHHVTSYALFAMLVCLEVGQLFGTRRRDWRLPALLVGTALLILVWDLGVATDTVGYFTPIVAGALSGLTHPSAHHAAAVLTPTGPLFETTLEYLSVLLLCGLVPFGVWNLWHAKRRPRSYLRAGFVVGAAAIYLAVAAREVVSGGAQLWGRAATFVFMPASLAFAWTLRSPTVTLHFFPIPHRVATAALRHFRSAAVVVVVLLALGGIAGGWPPYYARLPGPYKLGAWERSVDARELDLAAWASSRLTHDNGVAAGYTTAAILGSLGDQANVGSVPSLFESSHFQQAQVSLVARRQITLIVVNLREARFLPADGYYFSGQPLTKDDDHPIPLHNLTKFASIPGLSCIYSDGQMLVYDATGSLYRPGRGPSA